MLTIEGFYQFLPLVDNTRDVVAHFGEISDDALTYVRDKTYLVDTQVAEQTTMTGFYSVKDNQVVEIPADVTPYILRVGQYLLTRGLNGDLASQPTQVVSNLQAEFNGELTKVQIGPLEQDSERDIRLPQWVQFCVAPHDDDNTIRIWLADHAFRGQFSRYHIEIIPPFEHLDDFFQDPLKVKNQLLGITMADRLERAQKRRGNYPYTLLQSQQYLYYDAQDSSFSHPTDWLILIYGRAGNNFDLIRQTIVDYILENSSHTREEWAAIFPDLFVTTEFVITPFWHRYSVPNRERQAGIYSPSIGIQEALALLKETTQGDKYTNQWIDQQAEISQLQYKSLAFGVVGNPENRDEVYRFSQKFADYMVITNTSDDFNRITPRTQEFMDLFSDLIREAETDNASSITPSHLSRFTRNNITYIAGVYENINYLVVTKRTLPRNTGV